MKKDTHLTKVVFRKWPNGDILALFPDDQNYDNSLCSSYEHIGQHSDAEYNGCIKSTKRASPKEFAALKKELESLGYNLKVRMRK